MNRLLATHILATLLLLISTASQAQAVQEYEYAPNHIYPVRTGLGITTQIELSPDETVVDYSTGFSNGWELTRRENVFYLKPRNVDVDTNLVVRTETHSYIFELRVVATDWKALDQAKQAGVQYRITFRYPNDTRFKSATPAITPLSTALESSRAYYFDYDFATRTRQHWLIPVTVHDDGQFTYIRMKDMTAFPSGNFPAVFARERQGGEEFVVNSTVENNIIVVHGTYPFLVIRHGKEVIGLRRRAAK
ncbi:MAG: type IV secretion system protein VirB9 [Lysobacter sp.]|nr:MAG: type IV secretion system protein VirB9 [Lysobacter sp.]